MRIIAPRWIDFHCHLDLYPDYRALVAECDNRRIATLAVTTTPKAFARNVEMAAGSPFVMVGLGLHPQLVAERADELRLWEASLDRTRFVGEIGLDAGPKFYSSFHEQQRVFARILRACNEQGGKILSIHSVRCVAKVLNQLEAHLTDGNTKPVLHWFTGTVSEAKRAAAMGCYFSINAEMLRSPKAQKIVHSLAIDRLLTETDGPFVLINKRPARPTDIPSTVEMLAALKSVHIEEMSDSIRRNFARLISEPSTFQSQERHQ